MVGVRGFEPPTPASRTQYSTRLSYTPMIAFSDHCRPTRQRIKRRLDGISMPEGRQPEAVQWSRSTANRASSIRQLLCTDPGSSDIASLARRASARATELVYFKEPVA